MKEVFDGARALALDARPAYLAAACDGDEALRQEIEALLASHEQAASFLEKPAVFGRRLHLDEETRGSVRWGSARPTPRPGICSSCVTITR
jgi:hypothetical protein